MPNLLIHPAENPVDLRLYAGDNGEATFCYHPSDSADTGSVSPCFRPDDDQPTASTTDPGRPVSPCFHPGDISLRDGGNVNSCRHAGDDLAAGLHLTLTGAEEQHLAALTVRP